MENFGTDPAAGNGRRRGRKKRRRGFKQINPSRATPGVAGNSSSEGGSMLDGVPLPHPAGEACEEEKPSSLINCLSHGSISVIGRMRVMEDAVRVVPGIIAGEFLFFAVYDGHGGARVANACRDRLHQVLVDELDGRKSTVVGGGRGGGRVGIEWEKVMMACFAKMDEEVRRVVRTQEVDGVLASGQSVGSTAVVVIVGKEEVVVANCGVSRAVLGRGGAAMPLSHDHKPDRSDEKERVEAIGGRSMNSEGSDIMRSLGTSRSIGDHHLKPYMISEPEVTVIKRTELDNFLIIATDGLWDVVSNEVGCNVVGKCLGSQMRKNFSEESAASDAAALLAGLAMAKGSKDNISVIVVELNMSN